MDDEQDFLMPLVETADFSGYYMEDIAAALEPEELDKFTAWMRGQTCAIHKGKVVVYGWDWENYRTGGKVYD